MNDNLREYAEHRQTIRGRICYVGIAAGTPMAEIGEQMLQADIEALQAQREACRIGGEEWARAEWCKSLETHEYNEANVGGAILSAVPQIPTEKRRRSGYSAEAIADEGTDHKSYGQPPEEETE